MRTHAEQFAHAGIPFIFDPGQGMPLFDGPELLAMIDKARYVAVNDYEGRMLAERTGIPLAEIAQRVDALIVTLGRGRLGDPCGRRDASDSRGQGRGRASIPRDAATPIAPACSTASRRAGTGSAPGAWHR